MRGDIEKVRAKPRSIRSRWRVRLAIGIARFLRLYRDEGPMQAFTKGWLYLRRLAPTGSSLAQGRVNDRSLALRDAVRPTSSTLDRLKPVVALNEVRGQGTSSCFVVRVERDDPDALERTMQSILRQTEPFWEVLLAPSKGADGILGAWLDIDWRIRRLPEAGHARDDLTCAALYATSDFIGLIAQGDSVDDELVQRISGAVRIRPDLNRVSTDGALILANSGNNDAPVLADATQQRFASTGAFVALRRAGLLETMPHSAIRIDRTRIAAKPGMTLKFDCDPSEAGMEATYHRLIAHISGDAAADEAPRAAGLHFLGAFSWRGAKRDPQVIAIRNSGLFDADFYEASYKDVAATGADPLWHYIRHGDAEGRWPNAYFDPAFYRDQLAEPDKTSASALYHFITVGETAGLRPCAAFDPDQYIAGHPEFGLWMECRLAHFLWIGRHHGFTSQRRARLPAGKKVAITHRGARSVVSPLGLRRGVNVIGPLDRVAGLGVSARGYLEAVGMTGFGPVGARVQKREFGLQSAIEEASQFPDFIENAAINLVHMNGDALPLMLREDGAAALAGRYNIAIWYWELPTLLPEWWALMDNFHAFWAPTPFIARALRQVTSKPVWLVPPYLSYLARFRKRHSDSPATARFVYCFDANSIVERKNPGVLLDAFLTAFPTPSAARLTFKMTYPNRQLPEVERLYVAARDHANIEIIDRILSDAELYQLIASATAYVSPHRSEGLGLTVIEAMAFGTPVIGTSFGGTDQLITQDVALPIRYGLAEIASDHGPYAQGFVWAEPDEGSLVEGLRAVMADPVAAQARAKLARNRILAQFASHRAIQTCGRALDAAAAEIGL